MHSCQTSRVHFIPFNMAHYWRNQGFTFLKYLDYSSKSLRACLKSSKKSDLKSWYRDENLLVVREWADGKKGTETRMYYTGAEQLCLQLVKHYNPGVIPEVKFENPGI